MVVGVDSVHVNDFIECLVQSGKFWFVLDLALLQAVRQIRFLSVQRLEFVIDHGVP